MPLTATPNTRFFSLQKGLRSQELKDSGADCVIHDLSNHLDDFADTAAAIDSLNVIVMTDSSVAHLAASLNKSVIKLFNAIPYGLYALEDKTTSWYPSMTLVRQSNNEIRNSMLIKISVVLKFVIVLAVISFFVMRIVTFDGSFLAKAIGFLIAFFLCGLVVYEAKFGAGEFMKLKSSAESKMPKVVAIIFGVLIIPFYIFSVYGLLFPLHLALSEKKVKVFDATYIGKSHNYRYRCKNEIYLPDLDLSYCVRDKSYLNDSKKIKYYRFKILLETKQSVVGFSVHLPDKKIIRILNMLAPNA